MDLAGGLNDHDGTMARTQIAEITGFKPRGYQQEMFEESMKGNIIVAMAHVGLMPVFGRTGSGKTDIAVMRVAAELEKCHPEKLAWILTPNTALCAQQHEKFKERLPGYQHRILRGSDGVDKWKSSYVWDAVLKDIRVVASTPQVLLDALIKGFVRLAKICLLVFDEAHRATGGAPMRQIMRHFYHSAPIEERPATLSLTASPAGQAELEQILDAEIKTPSLSRAELEKYVHLPELIKVSFGYGEMAYWPGIISLRNCLTNYDLNSDPYILELLQQGTDREDTRLAALLEKKKKTYCLEQLSKLVNKVTDILDQVGVGGADWYVRKCIARLKLSGNNQLLPDINQREREHLLGILERSLDGYAAISDLSEDTVTAKFKILVHQLSFSHTEGLTGIVFAKQRATVAVLAHLLSVHPDIGSKFRVGAFVGASSFDKKADVGDLFDLRAQEEAFADFKREPGGLLVATSALEEGIDVPSCNFVVCYDEPENVVSYVQRRGRARKEKSKYVIFMPENSSRVDLFHRLETMMIESYREDRRRIERELEEERIEEHGDLSLVITSTGAKLPMENAKQYLFHFVQTISSDFSAGEPEYTIHKDFLSGSRVASLQLPGNIPSHLRSFTGIETWRTEKAAVQDVSLVAMIALHKSGLLNDNLLPLVPKDPDEQIEISRNIDSTVQVQPRIDPRYAFADAWTENSNIFPVTICVDSESSSFSMTLMMPKSVTLPPRVRLFGLSRTAVDVSWEAEKRELQSGDDLDLSRVFTHLSLSSVIPHRLRPGQIDFILPFIPSEWSFNKESSAMLSHFSATTPVQNTLNIPQEENMGILRDTRRPRSRHILQKIHEAMPTQLKLRYDPLGSEISTDPCPCVQATEFTKRLYSLRPEPVQAGHPAYSRKYELPLEHCSLDNLPLRYSRFALIYPALLYYWETTLLAEHLQQTILASAGPIDRQDLVEAISAPSARLGRDYQRLEFLGDRLLKFITALHLMATNPYWPEKYLSRKRDQIVSNQNLASNSLSLGLDRFITTATFSANKWRPSYIHDFVDSKITETRVLSTKVIADVVEAIIGASCASFLRAWRSGSSSWSRNSGLELLDRVQQYINVLLPNADIMQASAALNELHTTAASEPPVLFRIPPELQQLIGYNFRNPNLLVTAITHPSFNREQCTSYDRLEFLGDAILDHIITIKLFPDESEMPPSRLHTAKECLVSKDFLAFICLNWSTDTERILLPESTPPRNGTSADFERTVAEYSLWHFMRHSCADITIYLRTVTSRFAKFAPAIREALENGKTYPWTALTELQAPKFLSDMIESLIGAVFIDSQGSLLACEELLEHMGILKYLQRILAENSTLALVHPKERLGILVRGRKVEYVLDQIVDESTESGETTTSCTVFVAEVPIASVTRKRFKKFELEVLAAAEAVRAIETGVVTLPDFPPQSEVAEIDGEPNEMVESGEEDEVEEEEEMQTVAGMAEDETE